jgi:hypothetical protein
MGRLNRWQIAALITLILFLWVALIAGAMFLENRQACEFACRGMPEECVPACEGGLR